MDRDKLIERLESQPKAGKVKECATEVCGKPAMVHVEFGGVGSDYCADCAVIIEGVIARARQEEIVARQPEDFEPYPAPSLDMGKAVEAGARAICLSRGVDPETLYEIHVFTGSEPFDREDSAGRRFEYAWRKQEPHASAALRAAAPFLAALFPGKPTHRHKKRGSEYVLLGYGKMQTEHWRVVNAPGGIVAVRSLSPVDMREVAIYRSVSDGSLWARPREEFEDGRFEVLT